MKLVTILALIVCLGGLSACYKHHPHHGGNHCPPGHAKKGWC